MTTKFKVVIPARYASSRLPGKPLILLAGRPMIAHVCDRAMEAGAEQVVVATDDQRIFDVVNDLGVDVTLTDKNHESGTERIAEVVHKYHWKKNDIVVNLQGDEPLLPGKYIHQVAEVIAENSGTSVATLASEITDRDEIFSSNVVKVVLDKNDQALYFSRAAIPWDRKAFEDFNKDNTSLKNLKGYLRHIGLYAYTVDFLDRYISWQKSNLESIEVLEQLRILWHGEAIKVKLVDKAPPPGVDTNEDVIRIEQLL